MHIELLRTGKSAGEAYYLSRIFGPVGDAEFGSALQNVRRTGYPRKRSAYVVERAAIWIWDLPGGTLTGDKDKKAEGRADQDKGPLKKKAGAAKDLLK